MREYDEYCRRELPEKIPGWTHPDFRRRVGDCIYDFSKPGPPKLRPSVHGREGRLRDLSGKNALLSRHFYYFGDEPIRLHGGLMPIVHRTQGHKSRANAEYAEAFVDWIEGQNNPINGLVGEPQHKSLVMSLSPDCGDGHPPLTKHFKHRKSKPKPGCP
jgi:hypothetical protein